MSLDLKKRIEKARPKEKKWRMDKAADKLGMPIDKIILPLVEQLNRLGIEVDIDYSQANKIMTELLEPYLSIRKKEDKTLEYIYIPYHSFLRVRPHIDDLKKAQDEVLRFAEFLKKLQPLS